MKIFVFFLAAIMCLCGCSEQKEQAMAEQLEYFSVTDERDILPIFYESAKRPLAKFEPPTGCMLGAFVMEDKLIDGDWKKFEEVSSTEHNIYEQKMAVGEEFPLMWALECFTQGRIPMVSLYPNDMTQPFIKKEMEKTIEEIGKFQIPIFLRLYPNPTDIGTAKDYKDFFVYASKEFRKKAPNAVLIWSIPLNCVEDAQEYYPGDMAVDWIGVDIIRKSGEQGNEIQEKLEKWYYLFQKHKPLMISQLGISHYSTKDSTYTEKIAMDEITEFYNLVQQYPAIKAIIYRDVNFTSQGQQKLIRENYLLTESTEILEAYKKAASSPWFYPGDGVRWERSPYYGYLLDDKFYIPKTTAENDLQVSVEGVPININGKVCFFLGDIKGYRINLWDGCLWLEKKR